MISSLRSFIEDLRTQYNLPKIALALGSLLQRNLIILGVSLGVASVVTRVFSREDYGTYAFTVEIFSALGFLSLPGLVQTIIQETAKGRDGSLRKAQKLRLSISPFYSVVLLGIAFYYYFLGNQQTLAFCFLAISVVFPLKASLDGYRGYLLGKREFSLYARLPILVQAGVGIATALTAWLSRNPALTLFAFGLTEVILNLTAYLISLRMMPPKNKEFSSSAVRFGIGLSFVNIMASISSRMDTILVGTLLSMPQVAVLDLASMPLEKSKMITGVFGEYFSPGILSKSGTSLYRRANQVILVYVSIVFIYALCLSIALPLLFRLLFPDYLDVVPLAIFALFSMVVSAPANIMELTFFSEERLFQTGFMRTIQFAFDVGILYICISLLGVLGAFVARFFAGALRSTMASFFYFKNRKEILQRLEGAAAARTEDGVEQLKDPGC
jgi:O-antigen/teichoic acid export membrane protein